jgi:hypothetical protein
MIGEKKRRDGAVGGGGREGRSLSFSSLHFPGSDEPKMPRVLTENSL